ncbi:putative xylanase/chitin deacetylase [Terriglobus roseus DSM 18391]|uniref:Putative xylanase/chitin deacetylase n=1 Tax=Terriglobus roseus (strain DSM 18391 / NRRL B-41598 / KBS 63) TaxID=926566 RepID=I3ZLK2_TERRK|nr:polysaccharide deacetylase family protein [Terriglobus roseus]AFL90120.1 putative xylanase/chitin deacetylase [Terriglobus roseus DSM 18391]
MNALFDVGVGAAAVGLLAGGYAYAANWPTSQIFGRTLIAGPDSTDGTHTVALTYDDGPSPRNTSALLDLLAEHRAHATFFLIGEHVRKHPELARRVVAGGHAIGNHTTMHPNLRKKSDARVREELTACQKTIEDTLGVSPVLFRPPYGARRPGVLRIARSLGLTPVMWNVTAHDWGTIGATAIQARVDKGLHANAKRCVASNVLLHDASHLDGAEPASRADTLIVTRTLLERDGLRFVTPLAWLEQSNRAL